MQNELNNSNQNQMENNEENIYENGIKALLDLYILNIELKKQIKESKNYIAKIYLINEKWFSIFKNYFSYDEIYQFLFKQKETINIKEKKDSVLQELIIKFKAKFEEKIKSAKNIPTLENGNILTLEYNKNSENEEILFNNQYAIINSDILEYLQEGFSDSFKSHKLGLNNNKLIVNYPDKNSILIGTLSDDIYNIFIPEIIIEYNKTSLVNKQFKEFVKNENKELIQLLISEKKNSELKDELNNIIGKIYKIVNEKNINNITDNKNKNITPKKNNIFDNNKNADNNMNESKINKNNNTNINNTDNSINNYIGNSNVHANINNITNDIKGNNNNNKNINILNNKDININVKQTDNILKETNIEDGFYNQENINSNKYIEDIINNLIKNNELIEHHDKDVKSEIFYIINNKYINKLKEIFYFGEICQLIKPNINNNINEIMNQSLNNLNLNIFKAKLLIEENFKIKKNTLKIKNICIKYYSDFALISKDLKDILSKNELIIDNQEIIEINCFFRDNMIIMHSLLQNENDNIIFIVSKNKDKNNEFEIESFIYLKNKEKINDFINIIKQKGIKDLEFKDNNAFFYNLNKSDIHGNNINNEDCDNDAYNNKIIEKKQGEGISNKIEEDILTLIKLYNFDTSLLSLCNFYPK